jgi:hypothetical protein
LQVNHILRYFIQYLKIQGITACIKNHQIFIIFSYNLRSYEEERDNEDEL